MRLIAVLKISSIRAVIFLLMKIDFSRYFLAAGENRWILPALSVGSMHYVHLTNYCGRELRIVHQVMTRLERFQPNANEIVCIPGFFGYQENQILYLHLGSSVLALLQVLKADLYLNFTDVDGIFTYRYYPPTTLDSRLFSVKCAGWHTEASVLHVKLFYLPGGKFSGYQEYQ